MTPLLLVCSLCLSGLPSAAAPAAPVPAPVTAPLTAQAATGADLALHGSLLPSGRWKRAEHGSEEALLPPPSWQSWTLMGAMGAMAVGGNVLAARRGFNIGRLAIDETSMVLGSAVGIAGTVAASFLLGPKEGGLLLPLSERKLFTVLLVGGIVGGLGALTAAEAIGGHLDHPLALLGGAGGFIISSAFIIGLVDGVFGLPVWANAVMIPLGLVGGTIGGYALALPR